nr:mannitol dehydrogenase family protein [Marinobacterium sedimentorum]
MNNDTIAQLGERITHPTYSRQDLRHGIVHIGVGGFHRAHEAVYTEHLLRLGGDLHWGICGIGLRESDRAMAQVLNEQDYLYSLMALGQAEQPSVEVIGVISDYLFAPDNPAAVVEKLAAADTRIVSLTITEGGYLLDDHSGEFDFSNADIVHDLAQPESPRSVFGYLSAALAMRRARNLPAFTLMSCDNLPHNGDKARHALLSFAARQDPALADWIAENASFPNSMVDRITPMTTAAHKQLLQDYAAIDDAWPVVCEPFLQWVMEDNFCNGRPAWEKVGVQFTRDVAPYEQMKMRLLNASHSAMSYLGYLAGYRYSHEVMQDARLSGFIRNFMDLDVTPTLEPVEGINLSQYKDTLIKRFSNPRIGDQLSRLCMDGSSKIPKFILATLEERLDTGAPVHRFALILASWALYLHGAQQPGADDKVEDPLADQLLSATAESVGLSRRFLGLKDIFGEQLLHCVDFITALDRALQQLQHQGVAVTLEQVSQAG